MLDLLVVKLSSILMVVGELMVEALSAVKTTLKWIVRLLTLPVG